MDAASVIALLRYCHFKSTMTSMEKDEVDAFILGHKGFELCFASLQQFVILENFFRRTTFFRQIFFVSPTNFSQQNARFGVFPVKFY